MKLTRTTAVLLAMAMMMSMTACFNSDKSSSSSSGTSSSRPSSSSSSSSSISSSQSSSPSSSESSSETSDSSDPSVSPTMSADFSEIGALDGSKLGWGPGGPVDQENRSEGAKAYQEKYGSYGAWYIAPSSEKIYLTFDEGYENGYTSAILDTLKEKDVSAVFFVTMPYVKENPDLIRRMIDEGHIVGNHSTQHLSFPDMPLAEAQEDVLDLHNYVKENFDYDMTLFRFPMGEFCEQDLALLQAMGYQSVFWSFAYRDWIVDEQPDHETALNSILNKAHPGAIYLLHAVSKTNTEILGDAIDALRQKGYVLSKFVL